MSDCKQDEVDLSPCIGVCQVQGGQCVGCGRTLDQIANWASYSKKKRKEIQKQLQNDESQKRDGEYPKED